MKKIIISALFAILATASSSMAATSWTNGTAGPTQTGLSGALGSTSFSVSTNVTLVADGTTGGYNCGSKHLAGDTGYVSASNNAGIKEVPIAKATPITAAALTDANGATFTGL